MYLKKLNDVNEKFILKLEEHINKINKQTRLINELDRKIQGVKIELAGAAQYYDSKNSQDNYTGD